MQQHFFLKYNINIQGLFVFTEGETQNFIQKIMEIFQWRETVLMANSMKALCKGFFLSNSSNFLRKSGTCSDF